MGARIAKHPTWVIFARPGFVKHDAFQYVQARESLSTSLLPSLLIQVRQSGSSADGLGSRRGAGLQPPPWGTAGLPFLSLTFKAAPGAVGCRRGRMTANRYVLPYFDRDALPLARAREPACQRPVCCKRLALLAPTPRPSRLPLPLSRVGSCRGTAPAPCCRQTAR
jgi:hypothetical protein